MAGVLIRQRRSAFGIGVVCCVCGLMLQRTALADLGLDLVVSHGPLFNADNPATYDVWVYMEPNLDVDSIGLYSQSRSFQGTWTPGSGPLAASIGIADFNDFHEELTAPWDLVVVDLDGGFHEYQVTFNVNHSPANYAPATITSPLANSVVNPDQVFTFASPGDDFQPFAGEFYEIGGADSFAELLQSPTAWDPSRDLLAGRQYGVGVRFVSDAEGVILLDEVVGPPFDLGDVTIRSAQIETVEYVNVSVVPEPATMAVLVTVAIGLILRCQRR